MVPPNEPTPRSHLPSESNICLVTRGKCPPILRTRRLNALSFFRCLAHLNISLFVGHTAHNPFFRFRRYLRLLLPGRCVNSSMIFAGIADSPRIFRLRTSVCRRYVLVRDPTSPLPMPALLHALLVAPLKESVAACGGRCPHPSNHVSIFGSLRARLAATACDPPPR